DLLAGDDFAQKGNRPVCPAAAMGGVRANARSLSQRIRAGVVSAVPFAFGGSRDALHAVCADRGRPRGIWIVAAAVARRVESRRQLLDPVHTHDAADRYRGSPLSD